MTPGTRIRPCGSIHHSVSDLRVSRERSIYGLRPRGPDGSGTRGTFEPPPAADFGGVSRTCCVALICSGGNRGDVWTNLPSRRFMMSSFGCFHRTYSCGPEPLNAKRHPPLE